MGRAAAVLLFLGLGLGAFMVGMLFKIQHWPFAGVMLLTSYCTLAIGGLLFVLAVIKNRGLTGALEPTVPKDEGGLRPPSE